MVNAERAAI
ncbi:hypothetical protein Ahy_A06g029296 isoform C [Arachis hypogaea]|uniref:Uncharacterized protein n=1 Tax=Arachis hypogaea TaxID=3818 RepID=A0A445CT16_ARAHY|nr:hypothetical protein Ahy_A06g029296 isoform C [Arachis hypogaea]